MYRYGLWLAGDIGVALIDMVTIFSLPSEILIKIIKQLDYADIVALSHVPGFTSVIMKASVLITTGSDHPLVFKGIPFKKSNFRASNSPNTLYDNDGELLFIESSEISTDELSRLSPWLSNGSKMKFITTISPDSFGIMLDLAVQNSFTVLNRLLLIEDYVKCLRTYQNWQVVLPNQSDFALTGNMSPDLFKFPKLKNLIIFRPSIENTIKLEFPQLELLVFVTEAFDHIPPNESSFFNELDFTSYPKSTFAFNPLNIGYSRVYWELENLEFSVLEEKCFLKEIGSLKNVNFPKLKWLRIWVYWRDEVENFKKPVIQNISAPVLELLEIDFHLNIYPILKDFKIPKTCTFKLNENLLTSTVEPWRSIQNPPDQLLDFSSLPQEELQLIGSFALLGSLPERHLERLKIRILTRVKTSNQTQKQAPLLDLKALTIINSFKDVTKVAFVPAPNLERLKVVDIGSRTRTLYEICDAYPNLKKLDFEAHLTKETDKRTKSSKSNRFGHLEELVIWTRAVTFNSITQLLERFEFPKLKSIRISFVNIKKNDNTNLVVSFRSIPTLKHLKFGSWVPKDAQFHIIGVSALEVLMIPKTITNIEIDETPMIKKVCVGGKELELDNVKNISSQLQNELEGNIDGSKKKRARHDSKHWTIIPTTFTESNFDWSWDGE